MNCFQIVRAVLDELYQDIGASTEAQKDQFIKNALKYLSNRYSQLLTNTKQIDYSVPSVRFAYVYRYVTAHANFITGRIEQSPELQNLFARQQITFSCIGGGPGSDFLGILKYLLQSDRTPHLRCHFFDREGRWADSWCDIEDKARIPFRTSTTFQAFDVTEPGSADNHSKPIRQSNLITLTYFMSEIYHQREQATPFFTRLMENAQPNTLFLYLDNNSEPFYQWFDQIAADSGLRVIVSDSLILFIPGDEQKSDLGHYYTKFGYPKLTGNVAYRLCIKDGI